MFRILANRLVLSLFRFAAIQSIFTEETRHHQSRSFADLPRPSYRKPSRSDSLLSIDSCTRSPCARRSGVCDSLSIRTTRHPVPSMPRFIPPGLDRICCVWFLNRCLSQWIALSIYQNPVFSEISCGHSITVLPIHSRERRQWRDTPYNDVLTDSRTPRTR